MADIHFTQFLRPDGRPVPVTVDRPAEISDLAERIIANGFRFECEHLSTGHVSLTIVGAEDDEDIEVVSNGPEVPVAIDRMVKRFAAKLLVSA